MTWPATPLGKLDRIREVWQPSITLTTLAALCGTTRNAIAGVYNRNPALRMDCPMRTHMQANMARRKNDDDEHYVKRAWRERKTVVRRSRKTFVKLTQRFEEPEEMTEIKIPPGKRLIHAAKEMRAMVEDEPLNITPHTVGRPLLHVTGCKFAVNDAARGEAHLFCNGDTALGESWCAPHSRIVWRGAQ